VRVPGGARALIRFWFPIAGHHGVGVTAPSLAEATEMAAAVGAGRGWIVDARLVEQNVDARRLDPAVLSAARDLDRVGVWFP
jgi:hypothetical protein